MLGLEPGPGGQHPDFGTHNRLLSLGPDAYLEVIAIDPAAPAPGRARWFGLDGFTGPARLTNWILRSDDLEGDLARAHADAGAPMALSRADLRWRMAVPQAGALPFDNLHPALIQWDGPHPAPRLPDVGARLVALEVSHPQADALRACLPRLDDPRISFHTGPAGLSAVIDTPTGKRRL
jgi:hypothetical protein